MKSLRADFTEIYSGGGIRRSESGTLWIKKPGRCAGSTASPQKKIFVTDGATAWFYVPGERQARRTTLKKLDDLRSPLRYLLGRTKLEKELRGLSLAPDVRAGSGRRRGAARSSRGDGRPHLTGPAGKRWAGLSAAHCDGRAGWKQDRVPAGGPAGKCCHGDAEFSFQPPAGVEVLQSDQLEP